MSLHNGDAVEWARGYAGPLHHALLCDPPYHLTSITARFGKAGSAPAQEGKDGAFRRASAGFMGQQWDGGDVAFRPETWAAFLSVLHPGAFGMAFASSRGFHRMACAIEDAGFILHPFICYAFGSGFPKATRIDTQIDREAGAERAEKVTGGHQGYSRGAGDVSNAGAIAYDKAVPHVIGKGGFAGNDPQTDLARAWSGHRYGLQALKPAVEPILVFQKPYSGRPLDCITQTGAGALNIAGGRIGTDNCERTQFADSQVYGQAKGHGQVTGSKEGRWPSNLILDPEAAAMVDRQSGNLTSGSRRGGEPKVQGVFQSGHKIGGSCESSEGGASRFFFTVQTAIEDADPVLYRAKAGTSEREAGLDGFTRQANADWPQSLDGNDARGEAPRACNHPTVKPLSLTRYLASLLLPPADYAPRRLFVPFAGVASEAIGADLAGWEEVNGVEQSAAYCEIGAARRRFWSCNSGLFDALTQPDEAAARTPAPADLFAEAQP